MGCRNFWVVHQAINFILTCIMQVAPTSFWSCGQLAWCTSSTAWTWCLLVPKWKFEMACEGFHDGAGVLFSLIDLWSGHLETHLGLMHSSGIYSGSNGGLISSGLSPAFPFKDLKIPGDTYIVLKPYRSTFACKSDLSPTGIFLPPQRSLLFVIQTLRSRFFWTWSFSGNSLVSSWDELYCHNMSLLSACGGCEITEFRITSRNGSTNFLAQYETSCLRVKTITP